MKKNRTDLNGIKKIESKFEVDLITYEDLLIISENFVDNLFLKSGCYKNKISKIIFDLVIESLNFEESIRNKKLWEIYDKNSDDVKNFVTLVNSKFINRNEFYKSIENDGYATTSMWLLDPIVFSFSLCGEDFCLKHILFIENHPIMNKYIK